MPKRLHRRAYNIRGHAHELTFSCYRGYRFLDSPRVCQWLASSINNVRQELEMSLWAYVFMPNHVHLIVHFGESDYEISRVLQQIKRPVARKALAFLRKNAPDWLPKLEAKRGKRTEAHFWRIGGGYDRNVIDPSTLLSMLDYIHLNPVRKGLAKLACDWEWSSARWYAEGTGPLEIGPIPLDWGT